MRELAVEVIKAAAVAARLPEASVMEMPEKDNPTLPMPRIELEYMPETLTRSVRRIARFPKAGDEDRYRTVRERIYREELTIRAVVQSDDVAWLDAFVKAILVALPAKTADRDNNLVTVRANRAVRGGFTSKMVEVFKRRSNTIHIVFTGMVCRDTDLPLIRGVNVKDGITIG